jgi:hypothetical protein
VFCKAQIAVGLNRLNIGNMNWPFSFYNLTHWRLAWHHGVAPHGLFKCSRSAMHCTHSQFIALNQNEIRETGFADPSCVDQN